MIKETKRKINFITFVPHRGRTKDTSKPAHVTVNAKYGTLKFGKKAIDELEMKDMFVKFFYEPSKSIIGWQIVSDLSQPQLMSKEYKLVKSPLS